MSKMRYLTLCQSYFKIKLRAQLIMWDPIGSSCASSRAVQAAERPPALGLLAGGRTLSLEGSVRSALPAWRWVFIHLHAGRECSPRAQRFNCRLSCCCRTIIPYAPGIFPTSDPTNFSPPSKCL